MVITLGLHLEKNNMQSRCTDLLMSLEVSCSQSVRRSLACISADAVMFYPVSSSEDRLESGDGVIFDEKKLGSRKAHLLEDKQIPSVGVFDEVFLIWKAFGRITRDLGLLEKKRDKDTGPHPTLIKNFSTVAEDGVTDTTWCRHYKDQDVVT
ncbi:hypothetical protein Tco_0823125 [Tanacetum coccineum]|uniref:Uncharacterized protein n=1 Tax=Tanacetum coccineum TaxID=301880 RepID=A0ABQ5AH03_9ASTR